MGKVGCRVVWLMLLLPVTLFAQNVDEIIARCTEARGGLKKIKAVQSERLTGHISFGPDTQGTLLLEIKRPGKIREELTIGDKTMIRASNGKDGWIIDPFAETSEAQPLAADEMSNMAQKADIDRPLIDYKAKGNQVELVEKESVDGKDAFKLKITLKDGQIRYDYIGASTYLELKWQGVVKRNGEEFEAESYFRDYRNVEGIMIPFEIDTEIPGNPVHQKITFDKIEWNSPLDDARFEKPVIESAQPRKGSRDSGVRCQVLGLGPWASAADAKWDVRDVRLSQPALCHPPPATRHLPLAPWGTCPIGTTPRNVLMRT
jgi:outer membrane lipoprotein-sorting protein